ncbi:sarcosine oxidase subunit gamma [Aurantimonas sp. VKM B-3413]|uniref:sarcosine oxidase subunit gamma n=1 Tax=Aurantimonas sp. VKM B-3413 TaxID=2779401 RepID=UPI001E38FB24|nr:sarcosine oxidase subunit gamma family protein [Aurantimonas sp. VKM B-3413]MCB8838371.1 sarcosine oxidase subunit gamma [Aurantimonas sp. VKM B-3413]
MLEVNLARRTPALSPAPEAASGPVSITPLPAEGRLSFRAKALEGRGDVAGFPVGGAINTVTATADGRTALRLGPDEWLLRCPEGDCEDHVEAIAAAMGDSPFSLVDVSHRNVAFGLEGADAPAVLNAGCPLDLSDRGFPVGTATRTLLGKAEAVIARTGPANWRVECWRSFGEYVHALLIDAAKDFGPAS